MPVQEGAVPDAGSLPSTSASNLTAFDFQLEMRKHTSTENEGDGLERAGMKRKGKGKLKTADGKVCNVSICDEPAAADSGQRWNHNRAFGRICKFAVKGENGTIQSIKLTSRSSARVVASLRSRSWQNVSSATWPKPCLAKRRSRGLLESRGLISLQAWCSLRPYCPPHTAPTAVVISTLLSLAAVSFDF